MCDRPTFPDTYDYEEPYDQPYKPFLVREEGRRFTRAEKGKQRARFAPYQGSSKSSTDPGALAGFGYFGRWATDDD